MNAQAKRFKSAIRRFLSAANPVRSIAVGYINAVNRREHAKPPFGQFNERPVEYRFVFEQIAASYPKTVLDVGTGITALPHLIANCGCAVTAIDNIKDYWPAGMFNRHFLVMNDDIVKPRIKGPFDMVVCVSTLEHVREADEAVRQMFKLAGKGGRVVLTFPYNEKRGVDNVYTLPGSSVGHVPKYPTRAYSRSDLERWGRESGARVGAQEYWQFWSGEYWTIGERLPLPKKVGPTDIHQISCVLFKT